jgi:hypothetical protein
MLCCVREIQVPGCGPESPDDAEESNYRIYVAENRVGLVEYG